MKEISLNKIVALLHEKKSLSIMNKTVGNR
jgi:hypothetical protein